MAGDPIVKTDPSAGSFWRHLPSAELYHVTMIAANPNTGERAVVYEQPNKPGVYYWRPFTEFKNRFTWEKSL